MKIALYSPFLADNIGGGERYLLTVAQCLLPSHQIDLIIQPGKTKNLNQLKKNLSRNFNLKLSNLNIISGPFGVNDSSTDRKQFTKAYDIFYYMTDGSFFVSKSKLNIVHFMIPFNQPPNLIQRLKLNSWQVKVANSFFTKNHLEKNWKIKIDHVHWGAVSESDFPPQKKKNIILNVGRFFSPKGNKHSKRQDFLVNSFKLMCDQGLTHWQLILNGPVDKGRDNVAYLRKVKKLAKGYPVIINNQGSFKALQKNYGQAKIYWHATGYGLNQVTNPQAVEHLGLSTVEAMSAKAAPVVIDKGGQPEIVTHNLNGLLWQSQQDLIDHTLNLINNSKLLSALSIRAKKRAQDFSLSKFCHTTNKMFNL